MDVLKLKETINNDMKIESVAETALRVELTEKQLDELSSQVVKKLKTNN